MDGAGANSKKLVVEWRWVALVLATLLLLALLMWRPWEAAASNKSRTVSVTGTSSIMAEPDEYVFYPQYEMKGEDKAAILKEAAEKSTTVVAGLKNIGLKDKNIKTNTAGHEKAIYEIRSNPTDSSYSYSLSVTVTVGDRKTADKVQEYLLSTNPTGQVTPAAQFSSAKRRQLEDKARGEATTDARSKAEQMAENLGFRVGKVKSIDDSGGIEDYSRGAPLMTVEHLAQGSALDVPPTPRSAPAIVQPGEDKYEYSVRVVYFIH